MRPTRSTRWATTSTSSTPSSSGGFRRYPPLTPMTKSRQRASTHPTDHQFYQPVGWVEAPHGIDVLTGADGAETHHLSARPKETVQALRDNFAQNLPPDRLVGGALRRPPPAVLL